MTADYEQDLLTCGKIVALRVLKETRDDGESLDDVDFDYLIDIETRNLHDPKVLEMIVELP